MWGKLYGLGAGPGDPELITLKALRILQKTPVIAAPVARPDEESLALQAVKRYLKPEQEIITLHMPMSRDRRRLEEAWDEAANRLIGKLGQGLDVSFLTIGDASLYSTYSYIMEKIAANCPGVAVETIPGITSFAAAAARLNLPLARGDELLAVVPALRDPEELRGLLSRFPNIVLMKVARHYEGIVRVLKESGRAGKAVLVSRCGLEGEYFSRALEEDTGRKHDYLSLIIVKGAEEK